MQNEKYLLMAELVPFTLIPIGGHFMFQDGSGSVVLDKNNEEDSVNRCFVLLSALLIWCLRLTIFSINRMQNFNRIALSKGLDNFLRGNQSCTKEKITRYKERIEQNSYWKNPRFDRQRKKFVPMLRFWIWHTCWITSLLTPIILYHSYVKEHENDNWTYYDILGLTIWSIGFLIESISDIQRNIYRNGPAQRGASFLSKGLWFYSRHPNYFGEILLWVGFWLISSFSSFGVDGLGAASGCSLWIPLLSVVAPVFSWISLVFISGIPIVESRSDKKHHRSMAYKQWKWKTSPLLPLSPTFYGPLSLWCKKWVFLDHYQLQIFTNTSSSSPIHMKLSGMIPLFNYKHGSSSPIFRLVGSMKAAARQSISTLNNSLSPSPSSVDE